MGNVVDQAHGICGPGRCASPQVHHGPVINYQWCGSPELDVHPLRAIVASRDTSMR
jgi:hypothetical protein